MKKIHRIKLRFISISRRLVLFGSFTRTEGKFENGTIIEGRPRVTNANGFRSITSLRKGETIDRVDYWYNRETKIKPWDFLAIAKFNRNL